jgi:hypothetical protein
MAMLKARIVGPTIGLVLLVTGCENIPYYNDTLDWFSWSKYDPEVNAIVRQTPPPGELEAQPMSDTQAALRDSQGGYVLADPPPGAAVTLGATPVVSTASVAPTVTTNPSTSAASDPGAPLVGVRNSVGGSVSWRSLRGSTQ